MQRALQLTLSVCALTSLLISAQSHAKAPITPQAIGTQESRAEAPSSTSSETRRAGTEDNDKALMEAASAHYARAMAYYKEGFFFDAARSFDAAHALIERPVFIYNAGRAWEEAGDLYEALARFKRLAKISAGEGEFHERASQGVARIMTHLKNNKALKESLKRAQGEHIKARLEEEEASDSLSWEWVAMRLFAGVYNLTDSSSAWLFPEEDVVPLISAELVLFTMLWDWGYWDILRLGGGWPMYFTWGGSLGYRQVWGPDELRTGIHITSLLFPYPSSSGVEAIYLRRYDWGKLEAGARMNVYPTSVSAFIGIKF